MLAAVREKAELEKKTMADIASGKHDTSWIDPALRRIGCDPTPRRADGQPAVAGSITARTTETVLAGKPPFCACSITSFSLSAM